MKPYPDCPQPTNINEKVRKYIDVSNLDDNHLLDLLKTQTYFFSRIDLFNDPLEGSITNRNAEYLYNLKGVSPQQALEYKIFIEQRRKDYYQNRLMSYAFFLSIGPNESFRLWQEFCKSGRGVCIQSTCQKFVDSCNDPDINYGSIEYRDFSLEVIPNQHHQWYNSLTPFFTKDIKMNYESEFRALKSTLENWPVINNLNRNGDLSLIPKGLRIPIISIENFIECIYFHPFMKREEIEYLPRKIKQHYPSIILKDSVLRKEPIF